MLTRSKVLIKLMYIDVDISRLTGTSPRVVNQNIKPISGSKVYALSSIKPIVKAMMVCSSKNDNELIGSLNLFAYFGFWVFLLNQVGVDDGGLMTHVLVTLSEIVAEVFFGNLFKSILV